MQKTIKLKENLAIPVLGFGTWQLTDQECVDGVSHALAVGYRHIDTADAYGNHSQVGEALAQSDVDREDIFLTSKVFRDTLSYDEVHESVKRFLDELQTDYLDLLLIHWPSKTVPMEETLKAMSELQESGTIKALGVSNFTPRHIEEALETGAEIVINQVEAHPYFNQAKLREFCATKNIAVTAYSPLGRGEVLNGETIKSLAEKYDATPAQVILSWVMARDMIAIPKSAKPARIEENFKASELILEEADLTAIDNLPQGERIINPPFGDFDY